MLIINYRFITGDNKVLIIVASFRSLFRSYSVVRLQSSRRVVVNNRIKPLLFNLRNDQILLTKTLVSSVTGIQTKKMPEEQASDAVKAFERLPKTIVPKNYSISLKPDLEKFVFDGSEIVTIEIKEETQRVVLNVKNLELLTAEYKSSKGEALIATGIEINPKEERANINFPSALKPGTGDLHIVFKGVLNDKMKGFYRSKYASVEGQPDRYAAVTQFEATDARQAFPCWDEPAIKATFEINLTVPKDQVALSNMPIISSQPNSSNAELKDVKFGVTPIMSTYLVAFIVGEFDYVEGKSADGVDVRVYTPVGKKDQGLFALEVTVKTLPYYKDYFNIAYPLPKMDLIAISDFASGAMENWGLVTYRETCLLVDPKNTSADRKQWIALVVGHELAHQWFGNLVTMEWWTHLWLNEGFASFVEYLCVDELYPNYHIWMQFLTQSYTRAMDLDALHNSHPIEVPVGHPSEIDEIFDEISYSKGASVIRMLHRYLGDSDFKKGMAAYLEKHKYQNTQTEDLWDALEESSGKPVRQVMTTWTKQKGFPVISVTQTQDGNNRHLTLRQDKFCADGKLPDAERECLWMIPISVITSLSPNQSVSDTLFSTRKGEVVLNNVGANDWIKLNKDTVGTYRVQYSPEMLQQLLPAIESKSLPPLDRLGLQNDLVALVQAGRSPTTELLKLMDAYRNEDDYAVWSSINACLGRLNVLTSHTDFQEAYHVYGRRLLNGIHQKLGWEPKKEEKHTDTLLRSLAINRLAVFQDPAVLKQAKLMFDAHVAGTAVIPADIRSAVYSAVAQSCDEKIFNSLFKLYRETDLHEEKDRVSRAMGAVKDASFIARVLEFAMSNEVRAQDTVFVVASVAMTKPGRDKAWSFFRDNRNVFQERYNSGHLIARLVKLLTENFASEEKAQEVDDFFAKNVFSGTERTVQQSLEQIRLNTEWLNRDATEIKNYINNSIST